MQRSTISKTEGMVGEFGFVLIDADIGRHFNAAICATKLADGSPSRRTVLNFPEEVLE